MLKRYGKSLLLPALILLPGVCHAQKTPNELAAKAVVAQLAKGDFVGIRSKFAPDFAKVLSVAELREGWVQQQAAAGKFAGAQSYKTVPKSGMDVVVIASKFGTETVFIQVIYNKEGKIAGMLMQPQMAKRTKTPNEPVARAVVTHLSKSEFEAVTQTFDATMKAKLPVAELTRIWNYIVGKAGAFQSQGELTSEVGGGYDSVNIVCKFAKAPMEAHIVFGKDGKVSGLYFNNHKP